MKFDCRFFLHSYWYAVIPAALQAQILNKLHSGHLGIVCVKALAHHYVWWPGGLVIWNS